MKRWLTLGLALTAAGVAGAASLDSRLHSFAGDPAAAEELYISLKDSGSPIPAWLVEAVYGPQPAGGGERELGGETAATAYSIPSLPFTDTGTTADNLADVGPYSNLGLICPVMGFYSGTSTGAGKDVFYSVTLSTPTRLEISLCGSAYDTSLGLFQNNGGVLGALLAINDDTCSPTGSGTRSIINSCLLPAGDYFIAVDSYGTTGGGAYTLLVSETTSGGPDGYGYTWKNNLNPSGPAYSWVDISGGGGGTVVTLANDAQAGPFNIGFTFPFYNNSYTQFYIGSNGIITFGSGSTISSNQFFPSTTTPNNVLAPFWDNLDPSAVASGDVYYYYDSTNNRLIVQFQAIVESAYTVPQTFEAILYPSGNVVYQYADVNEARVNSITAGMENSTGTYGINAHAFLMGSSLHDGLAIQLTFPTSDIAPPVAVHTPLTSSENAGPFTINATITDNWGTVSSATIYYRANGGAWSSSAMTPGTAPAWSGSIPVQPLGATVDYYISSTDPASNVGNSATWTFNVQDYTQPPQTFVASDDQAERVVLTWTAPAWVHALALGTPPAEPVFEDYLALNSNKDQAWQAYQQAYTEWQAALQGAERAFVNYKVYRDAVLLGTTTSLTYTDLTAVVGTTYTYGVTAAFTANESSPATDTGVAVPRPTQGGPDSFGYTWINSLNPSGQPYSWIDISATGTELTTFTDDQWTAGINMGITFPYYSAMKTRVFLSANGFASFDSLTSSTAFNANFPATGVPNNLIALYWDDLAYTSGTSHAYYLADVANGRFIYQLTNVRKYSAYTPIISAQLILYANGDVLMQYLNVDETTAVMADHSIGIENADGTVGLSYRYMTAGASLVDNMTIFFDRPAGDVVPPTIVHTPLANTEDSVNPYTVNATVTDTESAVAGATLYYQVNAGGFSPVTMTGTAPDFTGAIPAQAAGSDIQYYITATDAAVPPNTGTSATWSFTVVDISLAPAGLTASDGALDQVNLSWTAPAWALASVTTDPEPRFEDFLPLYTSKSLAADAFEAAHQAWYAAQQGAERSFLSYRVYRDGALVGTSAGTTYTDYPPHAVQVYTYHVTALFDGGESNNSNTDTGFMSARPTSGGPDASGYSWVNSLDETNPAVYNWFDISALGDSMAISGDDDSDVVTLPFAFPYYGTAYTTVNACSNGFLNFGTSSTTWTNTALPTTSTPNNGIYVMWDDLQVETGPAGSDVLYYNDTANNRVIFQWNHVYTRLITPVPYHTFQAILYPNGDVQIQYQDVTDTGILGSSVGTENSAGTVGLQVNFDNTGGRIADALAIRISAPAGDWTGPAIAHTPLTNTEDATNPYTVNADITDADSQVDVATLYYKVGAGSFIPVTMTAGTPPLFTAQIPAQAGGSDIQYYITASDNSVNDNLSTSATWSFSVVDYTLAPTSFLASDGGSCDVNLSWIAPAWAVALSSNPEPRFEDFLPLYQDKSTAADAFLAAHAQWQATSSAERSFITYNVYRDGIMVGSSDITSYTDIPPVAGQVYAYYVKAQFDAGESAASNTDNGDYVACPTSGGNPTGYTWMNSDDPSGEVTYSWTDISTIGVVLDITGDDDTAVATLPFAFPFYGTNYSTANVCSNGWLNFGATTTQYNNTALPTVGLPEATVAVFWDDMYVPTTAPLGAVYQYDDLANGRVIFQWNEVHPLSNSTMRFTFQAVLKLNGTIEIYYQAVSESQVADATVGIENADGTVGLQVNFDDVGGRIGDLMALRIKPYIPCGVPANLDVIMNSGNANLSWDAVEDALSYKVFASTTGGYGPFTQLATLAGTSYTDVGAQLAGRKFYQIVAVCE